MLRRRRRRYAFFRINIDQKVLSAKMHPSKITHTGSVTEIRDGGSQRLINHGNFLEKFSIRSVRTGMSLSLRHSSRHNANPPRIHGINLSHTAYATIGRDQPYMRRGRLTATL